MYTIYKIITCTGYSYVGCTKNPVKRETGHKVWLKKGFLGFTKIPSTQEYIFDIIAVASEKSDAKIIEARFINLDYISNPRRNCNSIVSRANTFGDMEETSGRNFLGE